MPYAWSTRSRSRLATCHPLLVQLMERVIAREDLPSDLVILCGHRDQADQDRAHADGRSRLRWPNSAHNRIPSMAVDVAPLVGGQVVWDWPRYHAVAQIVQGEWSRMQTEGLCDGYTLVWGGDWQKFPDGPHWEIRG